MTASAHRPPGARTLARGTPHARLAVDVLSDTGPGSGATERSTLWHRKRRGSDCALRAAPSGTKSTAAASPISRIDRRHPASSPTSR